MRNFVMNVNSDCVEEEKIINLLSLGCFFGSNL